MTRIFLLILFLFDGLAFAQEIGESETSFEYTRRIREQLTELGKLPPEKYFDAVDSYRANIEKFIEHKKRVCNGEFSTVILNQKGPAPQIDKKSSLNKLSREERKLCFREMKAIQITFIDNMFAARKRYLEFLHKLRLEELSGAYQMAIDGLKKSFDKKLPSRKKRRNSKRR